MTTEQQCKTALSQIAYFESIQLPSEGQLRELESNKQIVLSYEEIQRLKNARANEKMRKMQENKAKVSVPQTRKKRRRAAVLL